MRLLIYLELLFILIIVAVTQDGNVIIQSSPALSGNSITVSCILAQAYDEKSRPSVEWTLNGQQIVFPAYDHRFSSTAVSGPGNVTTLYFLTIDPSDSGDNNANVSCKVQGHPPSKEIRLYIYASPPIIVLNGNGSVTVEKNTLFTSSFQLAFDFGGRIHIGYCQHGRIVGTETRMFFDGHANVSLPRFPVVPTSSGILYVRIVVGGLPFIVSVFNLTVGNQKSLPKSSNSPPTSFTMASSTPTEIATTTQASNSMATTIAGTQISTNSTSDISSTRTTKPLTSDSTVSSPKAPPWTTSSEKGTELSSVVSNAAPDTNSFLIVTVVMRLSAITMPLLIGAFLVFRFWHRIGAAGSLDQSISIDDGDAVVAGQGAELQLRRAGQTDSSDSPLRDRLELATHREMKTPGMSSSPARSLNQSISKKGEDAASIVELHASVEKRTIRIKCQCLARHDECDRLFETKDLTPSKIVRSLEQEIDIDKLIDTQNKKGKARSKTEGKQKSTEEYKGGDLLEGLVIREDDVSLQKAHSSAITCHLQINHQRVTLKKNKADCNRRIGIRGGELRLLPSGVTLRISEGATSEPLFIKLSSFSAENNVTINGKTTFANLLQILPHRVTFTNTITITFSLGHFSCCDPQFCLYYNDGWSAPKEYKFMANLREQAPLAKFGTTTIRLTDAQRIEIESFSFCKICILSLPGPFTVVLSLFFRKDYRDKQIELKAVISCQCEPNIKQIRAKARTDGYTFGSDWYFRCQNTAVEKQYLEITLNKEENDSFIESKDKHMEFSGEQLRQVIGGSAYQFLTRNCFLKLKSCQEDIDDLSSVMLDCTYWQKPTFVYSVFNYKPTKLDSNPLKIYLLPKDAPTSPLTFSQSYTATDDESDRVDLDKKPTELQLTDLSKNIIKEWKFIARRLSMGSEEIVLIEKDNDFVREQSYQMLQKSGASIRQLCIALNEEQLKETACKVFPFASNFLDALGKKK